MWQFTERESRYCDSTVDELSIGFTRKEGGMAAGLLRQWPLLLPTLLSMVLVVESADAGGYQRG